MCGVMVKKTKPQSMSENNTNIFELIRRTDNGKIIKIQNIVIAWSMDETRGNGKTFCINESVFDGLITPLGRSAQYAISVPGKPIVK